MAAVAATLTAALAVATVVAVVGTVTAAFAAAVVMADGWLFWQLQWRAVAEAALAFYFILPCYEIKRELFNEIDNFRNIEILSLSVIN